ncbi:MAG: hypothetical protein ACT6FG_00070 [Methanosarcinaceae archaeon]
MRIEIVSAVAILLIGFIINEFRIVDMRNGRNYDLRVFHLFRLHNGIKYERFILLGIAGLYLLYILAECAFNDSFLFNAIPVQFLGAGIAMITYYMSYSKMFQEFHEYIMTISLIVNSLFLIMVCIIRTDVMSISSLPTPGLFLVLVCCYTIPIKFKTALVGGLTSSAMFIAVPIYYGFIVEAFYIIAATITLNAILSINAYNSILKDKESFGFMNKEVIDNG